MQHQVRHGELMLEVPLKPETNQKSNYLLLILLMYLFIFAMETEYWKQTEQAFPHFSSFLYHFPYKNA